MFAQIKKFLIVKIFKTPCYRAFATLDNRYKEKNIVYILFKTLIRSVLGQVNSHRYIFLFVIIVIINRLFCNVDK